MSIGISLIVLLAAVLRASWNAFLRGGDDRLWSMTIMCIAIALACALVVPFVTVPATASWGCVAVSALLHTGYNLFLVRTSRQGDFGQTYPIARGASPLLVSLGAAIFARERPDALSLTGVLLASGGIVALAFQGADDRAADVIFRARHRLLHWRLQRNRQHRLTAVGFGGRLHDLDVPALGPARTTLRLRRSEPHRPEWPPEFQ